MNEIASGDSYEVASERLERSLARLESGVRLLGERARSLSAVENEARQLAADRARLNGELERTRERADILDDSAAEVSLRLVDAMETVKSVLSK
jgi:Domain of unknown function (DUF4164)